MERKRTAIHGMAFSPALLLLDRSIDGFNVLQLLLFLQSEKARGPYDQDAYEYEEIDDLLIFLAYPVTGKDFHRADDQAADHGADHAAHAPQDDYHKHDEDEI